MKRVALLLSIFVFISTLFWPQLLGKQHLIIVVISIVALILVPQLRILVVIPITALYFTVYANLTLTGQPLPSISIVNENSMASFVDGEDHNIVVKIVSLISDNNRGYFNAKLIEIDADHLNYAPLIEMRWYKPTLVLQTGQLHRFMVRFKPVYGRANPAGFDRQKWSYSGHVAYRATIKKHVLMINGKANVRALFYERVKQVTARLTHQGLLLALSFADKSMIPFEVKQRIRNLGISHLFAISGLHIGLLFSVTYLLAQWCYRCFLPVSKLGWTSLRMINMSALIGAWGYAYLAGFSLPTQRAFLMLMIAVIIFSLKRRCAKVDLLLLVLFLVLIWDPLAVLSISLWLSFFAAAIILLLLWMFPMNKSRGEHERTTIKITVIKYVKLLFLLQLGLTFLMLPIQLISFSGLSLVAILVNFFAVPLFSIIIIPLALSASLFTLIYEPLALLVFQFCDQLIALFFYITAFVGESYQFYSLADEKLMHISFALLLLLFILHFYDIKMRNISYLFTLIVAAIVVLKPSENKDIWVVEVLDVGQGLSVLVRSNGETLLYDTGARYPSGFNMVDSVIAPYLLSMGIQKLDHLVISHSDNDHAGGVDIITKHIPILNRWAGEPLISLSSFKQCQQGQSWLLGKLQVTVLSPQSVSSNNNNNSCVLHISDGHISVLLTGDIEKKQERLLVMQYEEKLSSDILLAPHHGSRYSSSKAFINAVSPQWVVFSAGFMNRWGFPPATVLQRYEALGSQKVITGESGFIRFEIKKSIIYMQTFREDLDASWYHHLFSL